MGHREQNRPARALPQGRTVTDPTPKVVEFEIAGLPTPQGSKSPIMRGGKPSMIDSGTAASRRRMVQWRNTVISTAGGVALDLAGQYRGPIAVRVQFRMPMPASRPAAVRRAGEGPCTVQPDIDKLLRALLDGLTQSKLISDDARVDVVNATKIETTGPTGAWVEIGGPVWAHDH